MSAAWRNSLGTGGNASMGAGLRGRYLPMGARLAMATQLAPGALEATKDIDPTGRGRSKTERFGSVAGGALGNLLGAVPSSVTNRLGMGGGMAAGVLAGMGGQLIGQSLGAAAGRVVDRGVSAVRGVQAGDGTQPQTTVQRQTGSNAV
jgi:hypothetical protein